MPLSFLLAEGMIQKPSLSFTKKREQRQKEDKDTAELLAISQARKLFIFSINQERGRGREGESSSKITKINVLVKIYYLFNLIML